MSTLRRSIAVAVGTAALVVLPAAAASAHPLGNFSVNRYDGLVVAPGLLRIDHVRDLAEIPTVQAKGEIDVDGDGVVSDAELAGWARAACRKAAGEMTVSAGSAGSVGSAAGSATGVSVGAVGGPASASGSATGLSVAAPSAGSLGSAGGSASASGSATGSSVAAGSPSALGPISVGTSTASLRPGQAGLNTLRLECSLSVPLPADVSELHFAVHDFTGGPGWREVTARGDRMTLTSSDVPASSASQRLTGYPKDMLSSPLAVDAATLRVKPGGPALAADPTPIASRVLPRGVDGLTRWLSGLVAHRALTPAFAALAIASALLLGALHALAPGHGKTIMAAAAAGSDRRSLRDVLALGASVAVTHTAGVALLGVLIAGGSAFAPTVFGWLTVASGALVVGAGAALLGQAVRRGRGGHGHAHPHPHNHHHGVHQHDHGHAHDHSHSHDHGHAHDQSHSYDHSHAQEHSHARDHSRGAAAVDAHAHDQGGGAATVLAQAHDPAHDHATTRPPTARPNRRGPILLGFAGGLVPSPSAVLILVAAAVLGRLWFGVLLVAAYGLGLAACLAGVGLLVVHAGDRLRRHAPRHKTLIRLSKLLPAGTATGVIVLGVLLAARGLVAV